MQQPLKINKMKIAMAKKRTMISEIDLESRAKKVIFSNF